jgi:membrane protein YdbS with pleckstrin-like domain
MTDPHPLNLEIEIDRNRLRTYLRAKWLVSWAIVLGMFGIMFGLAAIGGILDQGMYSWKAVLLVSVAAIGIGLVVALLFAGALYFTFNHRLAGRFADELRISVEGPFLRIRQRLVVATDRKLHFRAIVDYAVVQDPLMRLFDIHALQMTTTGSGASSTITVPGVKDCLKARDTLSEIDCHRENQP